MPNIPKLWKVDFVCLVYNGHANCSGQYTFATRIIGAESLAVARRKARQMRDSAVRLHNAAGNYPYNIVASSCDCLVSPLDATLVDSLLTPGGILYELLQNEAMSEEDEEDAMAARTDIYYKGRKDQEKLDKDFFDRVTKERKDNLLSFLKEVRSESLSDETSTSRHRVEAIIRFVERQ